MIVIITKRRRECITAYCYYHVSYNSCVVTNFDFTTKFSRVQNPFKILNYIFFFLIIQKDKNVNSLTPKDHYIGRTAPLTSKRCILFIYSTRIGTEYFKNGINSPFLPLQNAVSFIIITCLVPVLFTFYIPVVLKLKKIIPVPKG